ncbi:urea ABC transporter substrate-binding protein [Hydrogenobacter sp. T-2]|uniref:urea ABC transporter substrate-binding protein n=1 Tax=Pampinifervens diazotrophicum TaxID=1632018 RepID=UPI002B263B0E|nr:urea ABC transporter substrate-binding protein [Hydrogenobacter sp. T-2]WPM31277.1 urea ABC transporter substrate-binding protein [Hydrogenobacter sp. T-2]
MDTNMLSRRKFIFGLGSAAAVLSTVTVIPSGVLASSKTVRVGVLHSLSGTMAISEIDVRNATLLAIEEINNSGGVMGHTIRAIVEDGASNPATFAQKAEKLILRDKVATVFGGWTSASRKAMLPVFERLKNLLWYPVQFEGNECSANIIYTGAQPNQQILPALEWAFAQGYRKIFLVGSDYVFPRTANLILKRHIQSKGGTVSGEEYVPLGGTDFSSVVNKIRAAKPDIVFNTINGDSNVAFFKQMQAAGLGPKVLPVISFSIAEVEAKAIGVPLLEGSLAAWNYFMSLNNRENARFISAYRRKYGRDALITDPMAHGYINVYLWKQAVERAGSFEPDKVRKALVELPWMDSILGKIKVANNQSLYQTAYIGRLRSDGQFEIIWSSDKPIAPEPYDPLAFPGKKCVL